MPNHFLLSKMNVLKKITLLILIVFITAAQLSAQQSIISKDKLDNFIKNKIIEKDQVFEWKDASDNQLWSSLVAHDSIVAIGYKPTSVVNIKPIIHTVSGNKEWNDIRANLIKHIEDRTKEIHGSKYSESYLFPYGKDDQGPHFVVRITDPTLLSEIREMEVVRYIDPMAYDYVDPDLKSDSGCGGNIEPIIAGDYVNIASNVAPTDAVQSWNHAEHNVLCAWDTYPKQGDGIGIAIFDSGISVSNPAFSNAGFTSGMSGGAMRSITRRSFFPTTGSPTDDLCGHGTAMAGLAAAPRGVAPSGSTPYPAGIAYGANLYTYRVVEDVLITSSDENNAVKNGLYHAAADPNIHIISMSLGNVVSNGLVSDGIIQAYNADKLIFCAAGTSTCLTNWYPVIFPAWMPETIACTGVIEGSENVTSFDPCCTCHDGSEVDFVVTMERDADDSRTAVSTPDTDANGFDFKEYVGGSSCATASMAGIAALAWSNNPTFTKAEILDKLILASSNYPARDNTFGWGKVDVCDAANSTVLTTCDPNTQNEVYMEITNIDFPNYNVDTGTSDAEWVLIIDGNAYYIQVPESGPSVNPSSYVQSGNACTSVPSGENIIINLGNINCGSGGNINISVETHEDDWTGTNCDQADEYQTITTETISMTGGTFTHTNSTTGNFVITYTMSCLPTIFTANISDDSPTCLGQTVNFVATPAGEANYEFFLDANGNGAMDTGESSLQNGSMETYDSSAFTNGDIIGVIITRTNGCSDVSTTTPVISPANYAGPDMLIGTQIAIADYETDGILESIQLIDANAVVDYDSKISVELLPGFESQLGAILEAFIDGCNGGLGGSNLTDGHDDPTDTLKDKQSPNDDGIKEE